MSTSLKWTWQDGFYFVHTSYGMWSIEQNRGSFYLTLRLNQTRSDQDFGKWKTSVKAKSECEKAHKVLSKTGL